MIKLMWKYLSDRFGSKKRPRVMNYRLMHSVCDDIDPYIRSLTLIKQLTAVNITSVNDLAGASQTELHRAGISYSHIRCLKRFLRYNRLYNELWFNRKEVKNAGNEQSSINGND